MKRLVLILLAVLIPSVLAVSYSWNERLKTDDINGLVLVYGDERDINFNNAYFSVSVKQSRDGIYKGRGKLKLTGTEADFDRDYKTTITAELKQLLDYEENVVSENGLWHIERAAVFDGKLAFIGKKGGRVRYSGEIGVEEIDGRILIYTIDSDLLDVSIA